MAKARKQTSEEAFREALRIVSPGTAIREAVEAILQSNNGAIICIGPPKKLGDLSEGGIEINAACTPQLLYELSKMDGAIILNADGTQICYANRFLKPDTSIATDETGTRHRAAERLARQAKCTIIAVSERRGTVTLYVHDLKHLLESVPELLSKATQTLQTLEKYINVLEQSLLDLSTREFEDMVTIFDVCEVIQRTEIVERIISEIEPYILELGTEGRLIELQMNELTAPLDEARMVTRDYYRGKPGTTYEQIRQRIGDISQQEILNLGSISQALGYGPNLRSIDTYLSPRGYRLLNQTRRLTPQLIDSLIERFGSLQAIIRAPKEDLCEVEGVGEVLAERIRLSLNTLRNQLALDRGRR